MSDSTQDIYGEDFGAEQMWGLKELPLPDGPPWWPVAPGWYVVAALILLLLIWALLRWRRSYSRNQYRRDAIARLAKLSTTNEDLAHIPVILKKTALSAFPRSDVAGLRGQPWIDWLNESGRKDRFTDDDARLFDQLLYTSGEHSIADDVASSLIQRSKAWARSHHADV